MDGLSARVARCDRALATTDLVKGQTIGIDATTLEANAALRSIVRRDSGETYQEFLTRLAQASGIETPTRADLARVDRKRPKKGRNTDWRHPHDPDARITKMKDGTPQGVNPRSRWRRPPCRVLTHSDGTIASRSLHMVLYRGWTFDCTPVVWLLRRVPRRAGHTALPAQGLQPRRIVQSSIATPSSTSRNCSTSGASSSPSLDDRSCAADSDGYQQLITWAERHGRIAAFGIEGTGSYGAGLARAVRRAGHQVLEVNRGDRRTRRIAGKSDPVDAETAARSVLAGQSTAIPKTADGAVEMMRHLKVARRTAVKARTSAMITLKQIVVTAPPALRETLHPLADQALLTRCRGWRCGTIDTPTASAKHTLRALARRWFALAVEIVDHDRHLSRLTTQTSPTLREGFGIGADTAAELLIIFGDTPDRIHAEAAFAKLCGACPIPASSGVTTGRHRLYRGGHRQANAALHRAVIVRMQFHTPTLNYVERRTAEGRPKREIIRCLKRFLAREIFQRVMADYRARQAADLAA